MTAWESYTGGAARWPEPLPWHDLDTQEAVDAALDDDEVAELEARRG